MFVRKLVLLTLILMPISGLAWWDCDWSYRFPVTISKPSGPPLIDNQIRLNLNAGNVPAQFDWSLLGDDLRLVDDDDQTELAYFIEQWDSGGQTAVVWVQIPSIPGGGKTIYIYFGAPPGAPAASTPSVFSEPGLKFHTRRSTVDPVNRATAEAAFDAASDNVSGYGCTFISDYTGVNNSSVFGPPNRDTDIGLFAEVFFEVTPAEAGTWQFRYGADFGLGGGLYVDDIALDEDWNSDLWWALDWNNTSEILQGSINLAPGTHSLRILGFEGCCDGGLTAQFQRPGGPWLAVSLANIPLVSRVCPIVQPTVVFGPGEIGSCPVLTVTRSTQAIFDPINNITNPKSIPGGIVLNTVITSNSGDGSVDAGTFIITEAIPANMALRVTDFDGVTAGPIQFSDGSPASGLTYSFIALGNISDDVSFSNDSGASYTYTPSPDASGVDLAVTNIRITPQATFLGNTGSGDPSASFAFKTVVQ